MSLMNGNKLKEQQRINDLQQKINREKQKLDKKLTRQKILLGAFMIELLEKEEVEGLGKYTAENLDTFLNRQGDKELMKELINGLKNQVGKVEGINNHV